MLPFEALALVVAAAGLPVAALAVTGAPAVAAATTAPAVAVAAMVHTERRAPARIHGSAQVRIPAADHVPFDGTGQPVRIEAFLLDRLPVTRAQYLEFVRAQPRWRRGTLTPAFADDRYLADWTGPLVLERDAGDRPVVNVSWFAARAYCAWRGGRLPTTDEWEHVAAASETERDATGDPAFRQRLIELYTQPRPAAVPVAGSGFRNVYGVYDLHGWHREWVADFNNVIMTDDSRSTATPDRQLYCAAGASTARDALDYAAFLRFSYRASLSGRATQSNLGFRCAASIP
jgi:formylglycine-generating enzyme